jgi:hypothetical protein
LAVGSVEGAGGGEALCHCVHVLLAVRLIPPLVDAVKWGWGACLGTCAAACTVQGELLFWDIRRAVPFNRISGASNSDMTCMADEFAPNIAVGSSKKHYSQVCMVSTKRCACTCTCICMGGAGTGTPFSLVGECRCACLRAK